MRVELTSAFLCVDYIATSSAYEDMCMCGGGSGMSCMYRLKSVGESTALWDSVGEV